MGKYLNTIIGTWFQKSCEVSCGSLNNQHSSFFLNDDNLYCTWYGALTVWAFSLLNTIKMQSFSVTMSPDPWEVDPEEASYSWMAFISYGSRHTKIQRIGPIWTSVTPALSDGKMKILCGEYCIGVLAFLTEWAIFFFKLSEALGRLCTMDYVSFYCGL